MHRCQRSCIPIVDLHSVNAKVRAWSSKPSVRNYRLTKRTRSIAQIALVEALREKHILGPMSLPIFSFKCPQVRCRTFYAVTSATEKPDRAPRCVVCNTPFLARDGTSFLNYRPTSEIIDLRSD